MLTPEKDAIKINRIINDPSIAPYVCGKLTGVLDVTHFVNDPKNVFFVGEHGCCCFMWMEDEQYELHTAVLPDGRGRWARDNFRLCRDWMWANTAAKRIVTLVPSSNRMALGAARINKFIKYANMAGAWLFEGQKYDIDAYVLYRESP